MAWDTSDRRTRLPSNWATIRTRILDRDGWLCQLRYEGCTRVASEVDHIGADTDHRDAMLRAVCSRCHAMRTQEQSRQARAAIRSRGVRPTAPHPGLRGGG